MKKLVLVLLLASATPAMAGKDFTRGDLISAYALTEISGDLCGVPQWRIEKAQRRIRALAERNGWAMSTVRSRANAMIKDLPQRSLDADRARADAQGTCNFIDNLVRD